MLVMAVMMMEGRMMGDLVVIGMLNDVVVNHMLLRWFVSLESVGPGRQDLLLGEVHIDTQRHRRD